MTPIAKRGRVGFGLLAAAGVFMLVFLIIFSLAGVYLLDVILSLWVSALIVSGIAAGRGILGAAGASILGGWIPRPTGRSVPFSRTSTG